MLLGWLWSLLTLKWILIGSVFFLVNCVVFYYITMPTDRPPGPRNLPFIGVLHKINDFNAPDVIPQWLDHYGRTISFYLADQLVIVLSELPSILEALNSEHLSDRPLSPLFPKTPEGDNAAGLFLSNGEVWDEQRRFSASALKSLAVKKTVLLDKITEELDLFLSTFDTLSSETPPLNIHNRLRPLVLNVLTSLVSGCRMDTKDPAFAEILGLSKTCPTGTGLFAPLNFFPWLTFLSPLQNRLDLLRRQESELQNAVSQVIKQHRGLSGRRQRDSFLFLFRRCTARLVGSSFSNDQMLRSAQDLLTHGTESVSSSIAWALIHMAAYPHSQLRVAEEIEDVLQGQPPKPDDRDRLPLTRSVLNEVQRLSGVSDLTLPLVAARSIRLSDGTRIPRGAWVTFISFKNINYSKSCAESGIFSSNRARDVR